MVARDFQPSLRQKFLPMLLLHRCKLQHFLTRPVPQQSAVFAARFGSLCHTEDADSAGANFGAREEHTVQ